MNKIRETVYATLRRVAEDEGIQAEDFSDESSLVDDIGFRSLHLARVLALLETKLDFDPFANGETAITSLRTVGDLCEAFERAAA